MTVLTCVTPSECLLNANLPCHELFSHSCVFFPISLFMRDWKLLRKWGHCGDYTSLVLSDDRDCSLIRQAVPLSPCHQIKHKCVVNRHRECEKNPMCVYPWILLAGGQKDHYLTWIEPRIWNGWQLNSLNRWTVFSSAAGYVFMISRRILGRSLLSLTTVWNAPFSNNQVDPHRFPSAMIRPIITAMIVWPNALMNPNHKNCSAIQRSHGEDTRDLHQSRWDRRLFPIQTSQSWNVSSTCSRKHFPSHIT